MVQDLDGWADRKIALTGFRWPGLWIISGWRSKVRQAAVNPSSPNSLHTRCPSLAVDLRVGHVAGWPGADAIWELLGGRWKLMGGRWGGDFTAGRPGVNRREQNHFDLGPGGLVDVTGPVDSTRQ